MPTFPVDLRTYLGGCAKVEQQSFYLGEGLQVQNRTAGGEVIRAGGAARLWRGALAFYPLRYADARALHAKLNVLAGQGASFLIGDAKYDAGFEALLSTVDSQGRLALKGVTEGRELRAGDFVSFGYAGRRALHQVLESRTATAGGTMAAVEVVPPIRPGWAVNAPVTVGSGARCKAVMMPGTLRLGASNIVATLGASFEWTQTLRENA